MASAYKNIAALVGATGDVTIYTCPTATEAIVKNLNLYNSHNFRISGSLYSQERILCMYVQFQNYLGQNLFFKLENICGKLAEIRSSFDLVPKKA